MSTNIVNQVFFLRTTRNFPQEIQPLVVEVNRAYVDTANAVNNRTIGVFPSNKPALNGEAWFVSENQRQSGFRQIFSLPPLVANHNIVNYGSLAFTRIYGTAFDGNIWYPLPYVDVSNLSSQIQIVINPTTYNVIRGATAPAINQGFLVLEWLSQP